MSDGIPRDGNALYSNLNLCVPDFITSKYVSGLSVGKKNCLDLNMGWGTALKS